MREILFKAKRIDNGEWVEGNLIYSEDADDDYKTIIIPVSNSAMFTRGGSKGDLGFEEWQRVDQSTICQYTGLTDKNGKLIWENDICDRKEKYPEIVKYHDGDWTLDYSYASNNESGFNYCNLGFYVTERNCVEVIGNIFDNTELMNE